MEHRDAVSEARTEATDGLRCEGDFGHEHDHTASALECRRSCLEVDLRLPASCRALEQDVATVGVQRPDDSVDGLALRLGEGFRLEFAAERVSRRRLPDRPASCPFVGRDERQRTGRGRAVVVGDPERELDERRRNAIDDVPCIRDLDALGSGDARLHHDAADRARTERDREDVSLADVVGNRISEGPCERPRRDEGIDRGERHRGRA